MCRAHLAECAARLGLHRWGEKIPSKASEGSEQPATALGLSILNLGAKAAFRPGSSWP